ncbi:MAG: hypothetical protein R2880_02375 [Deinococcales bacterium]
MFFFRPNPNFKQEGHFFLAKIRTYKSGEIIDVRISRTSELSAVGGGYFVRKNLVGSKSFDQATLEVFLTRGQRIKQATIDGGEFIPVKAWNNL